MAAPFLALITPLAEPAPQPPLGIWGPTDPRPTNPIVVPPGGAYPQPPGPVDPGYSPPWAQVRPPVDPGYSPPWATAPAPRPPYVDNTLPGNLPVIDNTLPVPPPIPVTPEHPWVPPTGPGEPVDPGYFPPGVVAPPAGPDGGGPWVWAWVPGVGWRRVRVPVAGVDPSPKAAPAATTRRSP